jgi:hypothetical protein
MTNITRGPGVGDALDPHGHRPIPTGGTAIEVQFLSLFVTVSFLKVRVRARAREIRAIRSLC